MTRSLAFNVIVWIVASVPLYAEVMDKEPTVAANWVWAMSGGLLAIPAWRRRVWLGAIVSVITLVGAGLVYREIADPLVGPAIQIEAGPGYARHFYASAATAVVLHALAAYGGLRQRARPKSSDRGQGCRPRE